MLSTAYAPCLAATCIRDVVLEASKLTTPDYYGSTCVTFPRASSSRAEKESPISHLKQRPFVSRVCHIELTP